MALVQMKLERVDVPGDGNCMFRALSLYTVYNYRQLRRLLVQFVLDNRSLFQVAIETPDDHNEHFKSVEHWASSMLRDGVWGDANCLQAFGLYFQCNVFVVGHNTSQLTLNGWTKEKWFVNNLHNRADWPNIALYFDCNQRHYCATKYNG